MALPDPVLARLSEELRQSYGPRLERAVLFGSRARGDFDPHSDYDVAVFLHDYTTRWNELDELCRISNEILVETGALISAQPFPAGTYNQPQNLLLEIVKDGVDL